MKVSNEKLLIAAKRQAYGSYRFSVMKGPFSGLKQFLATGKPLKKMKNAFCFNLKFLLVWKIFKFLSSFLVMYKNGLNRKINLVSKFMAPQPDILPNISRSKGNPAMRLGKLTEYSKRHMKNQEKSCTSSGGENVFWTFSEISKLSISQYFIQFVFIVYQVELSKYNETKLSTTCFYLIKGTIHKGCPHIEGEALSQK